jgi:hypothetical protein
MTDAAEAAVNVQMERHFVSKGPAHQSNANRSVWEKTVEMMAAVEAAAHALL